jgi:membrane fusion protein, multidrug efflux system
MNNLNKIRWILLFNAALLILVACGKSEDDSKTNAANTVVSKTEVVVSKVQRGPIHKAFTAMGTIAAYDLARVIPKVAGRVLKIYVSEGTNVRAGQILMQLSDAEYNLGVKGYSAVVKLAEVGVEKSKRDLARAESLHKEQAIAEQSYQDAQSQLEANKYQMEQAIAQVDNAKKAVYECKVVSPISGIVTSKFVNEGELSAPQSPMPAFIVENMTKVKLEVDLSEDAFGYLDEGNKCIVTVDAIPDRTFEGVVTKIFPSVNAVSKTFKVTITLDNTDFKLRSGMTARAKVVQKARNDAIYAPKAAFLQGEEGFYVFKLSGNKVKKSPVKIGIEGDETYEVINGLQPGDFVVVQGQVGLSDGTDVTAKEKIENPVSVLPVQAKNPETAASIQEKKPASNPTAK